VCWWELFVRLEFVELDRNVTVWYSWLFWIAINGLSAADTTTIIRVDSKTQDQFQTVTKFLFLS
jgi:hypothetical protein